MGLFAELQHHLSLLAHSALQLPRHAEYAELQLLLWMNTSAVTLLNFPALQSDCLLELTHSIIQVAGRRLFCANFDCQCQGKIRPVACVQVQAMGHRPQTRRQSCSPPSRS